MYRVRMRINGYKAMDIVTNVDFKKIYISARRMIKTGKREKVDVTYRVSDPVTDRTILFMYNKVKTGIAKQTHVGKWNTEIFF